MRISVFPKGDVDAIAVHRTMTVFDWITQARVLPIEGLELYSGMFWETSDAFVDRVGDALVDAGFEMPMLCVSPDFTHPDAGVRARELDKQFRMIEIADRLGGTTASCRVLSGQRHPEVSVEQGLDWAAEAITECLAHAIALDVTLGIENHYKDGSWAYPEFAQTKTVFLALLDRIDNRTHFGVQYDPSNAIVAGEDSADFLDVVIDRVVTMQASDRYLAPGADLQSLRQADGTLGYSPDLRHGVIGQGLNDYPRIFRTLAAAGYDGWISVEDGINGMHEMAESVDFLRDARERYFGGSLEATVATQDAERARAGIGPR
ncbi:MAG TPA: sugar phosphate isomerase/epimerase family protein, partial [Terrimesophilobacter sp.]|nr:sugar phosphate isomerase/epimerase family protein [Terrimesophilobacter sp.]